MVCTLRNKLKALKMCLKVLNKKVFDNMEFKIKRRVDNLEVCELKTEVVDLSPEELGFRSTVCQELGELF